MYSPTGHTGCRRVCFFIKTDFEKFSITPLVHQWMGAVILDGLRVSKLSANLNFWVNYSIFFLQKIEKIWILPTLTTIYNNTVPQWKIAVLPFDNSVYNSCIFSLGLYIGSIIRYIIAFINVLLYRVHRKCKNAQSAFPSDNSEKVQN